MKKAVIKGAVFALTFFAVLLTAGKIMNHGNNDMTAEMAPAGFPVVYMQSDGTRYNELHGYARSMDTAYMRDTITALDAGRGFEFAIETYGESLTKIAYEVRSVNGERLIENGEITDYVQQGSEVVGAVALKDLLDRNTEYELILLLSTGKNSNIRYYTRIIWAEDYYTGEKLAFVRDFHEKTFDKEAVKELARYMETDSTGDNSTLQRVDIHCSLNQVSWGNLAVSQIGDAVFNVSELAAQTATINGHYVVSAGTGNDIRYFYVEEYYRIRYTTDRVYLLDFVRTMNSILNERDEIYVNDKIMIGVETEDMQFVESEDGNVFAFEVQNRLYSYNVTTNKLAVVYGFYDAEHADARTLYNQHDIRILAIDEGGNVDFAVFGYMNRGTHEGEVGIQVYHFDSAMNTVEEVVYIPYDKTYQILKKEVEQLLYLNREGFLYLSLDNTVYEINLIDRICSVIIEAVQDESIQVSASMRMAVWQRGGELYSSGQLTLTDLGDRAPVSIAAGSDEYILPMGFMGEDLVYGLAKQADVETDRAGRVTFPMYTVRICDSKGNTLKTYEQEGIYVSGCTIQNNQIVLTRLIRREQGGYAVTTPDYIMNSTETTAGKNTISAVTTENYGKFIQIAVKKSIDAKTLQILTPKEVLYEGGRRLDLMQDSSLPRYYVYGENGVEGIYHSPAKAVLLAEAASGVVTDDEGAYVWIRGNRSVKNQIMAIGGTSAGESKSSLAVCLDTLLQYEGVVRNAEYLLSAGETVMEFLTESLDGAQILDLEGCSLDSVLYFVNRDIPVLASLKDGSAVLVIGFNQYNVVLMDPGKTTDKDCVYKMGIHDATKWFEENGNVFITYLPVSE